MIATKVAARVSLRSSLERIACDSVRAWPVVCSGAETVAIAMKVSGDPGEPARVRKPKSYELLIPYRCGEPVLQSLGRGGPALCPRGGEREDESDGNRQAVPWPHGVGSRRVPC